MATRWRGGKAQGLSAADHLRRHDAYPFLQTSNDLLITGPTQTNVNDLIFAFVEAAPVDTTATQEQPA